MPISLVHLRTETAGFVHGKTPESSAVLLSLVIPPAKRYLHFRILIRVSWSPE